MQGYTESRVVVTRGKEGVWEGDMGTAAQVHGWKLGHDGEHTAGMLKADSHGGHREPGDGGWESTL